MKINFNIWTFVLIVCLIAIAAGYDRHSKPTQNKTEWIDPAKLQPGSIRQAALTDNQMELVKRLQKTFSEVDPSPVEKWAEDFKRDANPEHELKIWESMANAFEAYTSKTNLSLEAKRDAYQVVLLRSAAPEIEVLTHLKLHVLTENDAKEIMKLYQAKPEPIIVGKP
jgi:hypothetical protein